MRRGLLSPRSSGRSRSLSTQTPSVSQAGRSTSPTPPWLVVLSGILDIRGFDGFHLIAIGEAKGFGRCVPCVPGDSLSLGGFLSEASYVTLKGGPVPPNPPWKPEHAASPFFSFFTADGTVPPLDTSVILTAPFVFTGLLFFENTGIPEHTTMTVELFGRGTGTVELRPNPFGTPVWEFAGARYEFAPVPEPATLVLVSSGLAAVAWRRGRRRRTSDRTSA